MPSSKKESLQIKCVSYFLSQGCKLISDDDEIAAGTDPFEYYSGAVCPLSLNLKIYLQGAFNGTDMTTTLASILPLTEPYSASSTETIENANVQTTSAIINAEEVVDWVKIQLRTTPTNIFATRVGLLTKDGFIIDPMTAESLFFPSAISGNSYYVVVQHRNHLGVMTQQPILIN